MELFRNTLYSYGVPKYETWDPRSTFFVAGISIAAHLFVYLLSYIILPRVSKRFAALDKLKQSEGHGRVVASVHAIVATYGAFSAISRGFGFPDNSVSGWFDGWFANFYTKSLVLELHTENLLTEDYRYAVLYLQITLGYFLYDFFWVVLPDFLEKRNFQSGSEGFHHVLSAVSYAYFLRLGVGYWIMLSLQTNEITTPLLHLRWFFELYNLKGTFIYIATALIFVAGFGAFRALFDGFVTFYQLRLLQAVPSFSTALSFSIGLTFWLLQLFWFYKIVKIMIAVIQGKERPPKKVSAAAAASSSAVKPAAASAATATTTTAAAASPASSRGSRSSAKRE